MADCKGAISSVIVMRTISVMPVFFNFVHPAHLFLLLFFNLLNFFLTIVIDKVRDFYFVTWFKFI